MPESTNKLSRIKEFCREVVAEYAPRELDDFNSLWKAYWRAIDCSSLEELAQLTVSVNRESGVRSIGAAGGSGLGESMQFITPIVNVAAQLDCLGSEVAVPFEKIEKMLLCEGDGLNVSDRVREIFRTRIAPALCELRAQGSVKDECLGATAIEGSFRVIWLGEKENGKKTPLRKTFDEERVDEMFREKRGEYALFVDEPLSKIYVKGNEMNYWEELTSSQRKLLGLVLKSLSDQVPLDCDEIATWALQRGPHHQRIRDKEAAQKIVCVVNKKLDDFLTSNIIESDHGAGVYRVRQPRIAFCWIGSVKGPSRMIPDL